LAETTTGARQESAAASTETPQTDIGMPSDQLPFLMRALKASERETGCHPFERAVAASLARTPSTPSSRTATGRSAFDVGLRRLGRCGGALLPRPGRRFSQRCGDTEPPSHHSADDWQRWKALQKALSRDGYAVNGDGVFDEGLEGALKAWQTEYGVTADGIAGPATRTMMGL